VSAVRTRPDEIRDSDIAAALDRGWGIVADSIEHAPVGFGSPHWRVRSADAGARWFVTVDDLADGTDHAPTTVARRRAHLEVALRAARAVHDHGLTFVVAPRPTATGGITEPLGDRFALAVYPVVDGAARDFGPYRTTPERLAVIDRLVDLHGVPAPRWAGANPDDLVLDGRPSLERAVGSGAAGSWGPGPFAEPARQGFETHARLITDLLTRYDALVASIAGDPSPPVLTHGEPHPGNTIGTADGIALIDWDTARAGPAERDLWWFADDADAIASYVDRTGRPVRATAIDLYRLRWDLTDLGLAARTFLAPHADTEDTRHEWAALDARLDRLASG
jgi:hypothetical protein